MLNKSFKLKLILVVVAIALLFILMRYLNIREQLRQTLVWIDQLGPSGPLIFALVYILCAVLLIPGSILTLGAGFLFGILKGSIYVSIAATLGATTAFLVGRYLARDWVAGKIKGNDRFAAVDQAVAREGWKIVLLTRLSPVFPFNLLNYSFGITRVSLKDYFFASWIGMLPGTVIYVYIGSLAGNLATLGSVERVRSMGEWGFYLVGLLATVAVAVYVTRMARQSLEKRVA